MSLTAVIPSERSTRAPQLSIDLHGESTGILKLLKGLWRTRDLLVILARKEFHVRYRRASFGILWALALPLLQSLVLAIVFSRVVHVRLTEHFPVFVLSGMVAWTYFYAAFGSASTSIVDGAELSSRVYFTRAILPLAQVMANIYGLVITLVVVMVLAPALGAGFGPQVLAVVPGVMLVVAMVTGFSLVASALHVYFRDVRYIVTAALLLWFYVSPIIYPTYDAPGKLRLVIDINPLTGVMDIFRFALVGGDTGGLLFPLLIAGGWTVALLVAGVVLQSRFDRVFSDLL